MIVYVIVFVLFGCRGKPWGVEKGTPFWFRAPWRSWHLWWIPSLYGFQAERSLAWVEVGWNVGWWIYGYMAESHGNTPPKWITKVQIVKLWVLFWSGRNQQAADEWGKRCGTSPHLRDWSNIVEGLKGVSMWNKGLQGSAKPRSELNWALFPQCFDKGWDMLLTSRCQWSDFHVGNHPEDLLGQGALMWGILKVGLIFFFRMMVGSWLWSWDIFKQVNISKTIFFFRPPWWVSVEKTMVEWTRYDVEAVMSFSQLAVSTVHDNHVTMLG